MMEVDAMPKQCVAVGKARSVDEMLHNVVSATIKQVFREEGSKVICDYFENKSHLKLEEATEKPEAFSASLEKLLGSGAQVIEKMILRKLCLELRLRYEEKEGYQFSDYLEELNRSARIHWESGGENL